MEHYMERKNMQQVGEMPQANASQATTEMRPQFNEGGTLPQPSGGEISRQSNAEGMRSQNQSGTVPPQNRGVSQQSNPSQQGIQPQSNKVGTPSRQQGEPQQNNQPKSQGMCTQSNEVGTPPQQQREFQQNNQLPQQGTQSQPSAGGTCLQQGMQSQPNAVGTPPRPQVPPYRNIPRVEDPAVTAHKAEFFQKMIMPTLLYALLYTFFMYNTLSSITMPLCVVATLWYCYHCFKAWTVTIKKDSYLYAGALLLIGISSATTGNENIIAMNTIAMALMLVSLLIHNFYDDKNWGFVKSLSAIGEILIYSIEEVPSPVSDGIHYQKLNKKKAQTKSLYILVGAAISVPLVVFIIVMLYQADAVFAQVIRRIFEDIDLSTVFGIAFLFVFAFFSAYCGIRALEKRKLTSECKDYRRFEPLIAITVLITISVVYIFFSMIQIIYLFLGKMQLPENYTYAQYAREGFFQLLFVCILNVIIVLGVLGFFRKHKVLNVLLAIISCCTYIMLASSGFRMVMYVKNYGMTFLRMLVLWTIALIGLLLAGILVQIFNDRFPLFRYGLLVVSLWYLAFSFSHPDYWIARYNLSDKVNQSEVDYEYLTRLSSDAAPVIAKQDGMWVKKYIYRMTKYNDYSLRKYNFSRAKALRLFREQLGKMEDSFCVILREPEGVELEEVVLGYSLTNDITTAASVQTEQIPATASRQAEYIAYLPIDILTQEGQDIEIAYTFRRPGVQEEFITDLMTIRPEKGVTYLIRMDAYEHEDGDNNYYIYQDYSF